MPAMTYKSEGRTMKKSIRIVASVTLIFAVQAGFACDYPARVSIPNGTTASKDEMLAGQKGVKQYVADMEVYLECLVEEEKVARAAMEDLTPEAEQQREALLSKKYNAAVEEMEKVAAQFNSEVQAYRGRDES